MFTRVCGHAAHGVFGGRQSRATCRAFPDVQPIGNRRPARPGRAQRGNLASIDVDPRPTEPLPLGPCVPVGQARTRSRLCPAEGLGDGALEQVRAGFIALIDRGQRRLVAGLPRPGRTRLRTDGVV